MRDLIERLERAAGSDGVLDTDIGLRLRGLKNVGGYWAENIETGERVRVDYNEPPYTASIDAALTLVPGDHEFRLDMLLVPPQWISTIWKVEQPFNREVRTFAASAPTGAIALCIAALKARATPAGEAQVRSRLNRGLTERQPLKYPV